MGKPKWQRDAEAFRAMMDARVAARLAKNWPTRQRDSAVVALYRKLQQFTQAELARRCGTNQSKIADVESGSAATLSPELRAALERELAVRFDDFEFRRRAAPVALGPGLLPTKAGRAAMHLRVKRGR